VESTVNAVLDKRFAKKQQMQGSKVGAHRLLQIPVRTLDGTLRDTFVAWYPAMAANNPLTPAVADAVERPGLLHALARKGAFGIAGGAAASARPSAATGGSKGLTCSPPFNPPPAQRARFSCRKRQHGQ
jgi:hypothetical protein